MIKDENGVVIGYTIFNEYTQMNGETCIMLNQCEISETIIDNREVLTLMIGTIYQLTANNTSFTRQAILHLQPKEVIPLLKEIGFSVTGER